MSSGDPVIDFEHALALVFDAQALTVRALSANPSKEEERQLNRRLGELKLEETSITAMIDALEDATDPSIRPPTDAQMREVARLTGEVENTTRANLTTSGAIAVTGEVFDLASELTRAA